MGVVPFGAISDALTVTPSVSSFSYSISYSIYGWLNDDLTTNGSWSGVYGSDGLYFPKGDVGFITRTILPSYVTNWSLSGGTEYVGYQGNSNPWCLQCPSDKAQRILSLRYNGGTTTQTASWTQSGVHRVAVCFGTTDFSNRSMAVRLYVNGNPVGSSRSYSAGSVSTWAIFNVPAGNISLNFTATGDNPSYSAICWG
jgi:hypothetical protein